MLLSGFMHATFASTPKETKDGEPYMEYKVGVSGRGTLEESQAIQAKLEKEFNQQSTLRVDGSKETFKLVFSPGDKAEAENMYNSVIKA